MKIKLAKIKTCVELEAELGLTRGDIREIVTLEDGSGEIETSKALTQTQVTKLETAFGMKEVK